MSVCELAGNHGFNDTLVCLVNNAEALKEDCIDLFNSLMAGLMSKCRYDLLNLCAGSLRSSFSALSCLLENIPRPGMHDHNDSPSLSPSCSAQLELISSNILPCGAEAEQYCPDLHVPSAVVGCLTSLPTETQKSFSTVCKSLVKGYQACTANLPLNSNSQDDTIEVTLTLTLTLPHKRH